MLVYIGLGVAAALFKVFAEGALVGPSPVIGPQVDVHVVDVGIGADLLVEVHIILAAPAAF